MITQEKLRILLSIVKEASKIALNLKNNNMLKIEKKSDGSYVTNADKQLDAFLVQQIKEKIDPINPIISEESVALGECPLIPKNTSFWSIDPIDSTKSFISMNDNPENNKYYCINVAFLEKGNPTLGIIHAPETETMWYGLVGYGAFKQIGNNPEQQIYARTPPSDGAILISSEEQITSQNILKQYNIKSEIKLPSAIKFSYIAEGLADYYFRKRNKACDWDIASAHALIVAAGGNVQVLDPIDFRYGVPMYLAPSLLATGKK